MKLLIINFVYLFGHVACLVLHMRVRERQPLQLSVCCVSKTSIVLLGNINNVKKDTAHAQL